MAKRRKRRKKNSKNQLARVVLILAKALWAVVRGLYWLVAKTCVITFRGVRRLWRWMVRGTEAGDGERGRRRRKRAAKPAEPAAFVPLREIHCVSGAAGDFSALLETAESLIGIILRPGARARAPSA